jgi:leader peptidase (prepilin peptidase)/N-methyltransferase
MLVELCTALAFLGLFWLEVVENVHDWPGHIHFAARLGSFPWTSFLGFLWHALLMSFLIVATVCDLKSREIPLQLTLTGTLVGLIGATLMAWPFPHLIGTVLPPVPVSDFPFLEPKVTINQGIYPWPFWGPLPHWTGEGDPLTGFLTGAIGALVGTFLLRAVGFVFSKGLGKEALGLGDADLMMMAGAFVGWQIVVVAFFLSVFPALIFGIINLAVKNDNSLPFGPSLALAVMVALLAWQPIGAYVRPLFFMGEIVFWGALAIGAMMFLFSFILRVVRGSGPEDDEK